MPTTKETLQWIEEMKKSARSFKTCDLWEGYILALRDTKAFILGK